MTKLRAFTVVEMMVALVVGSFALLIAAFGYQQANQWYLHIIHGEYDIVRSYLVHSDLERTFKTNPSELTKDGLFSENTRYEIDEGVIHRKSVQNIDSFEVEVVSISKRPSQDQVGELGIQEELILQLPDMTFSIYKPVGASTPVNEKVFGKD